MSVQNQHEEFDKFWSEHLKILKICFLIDCFWTKHIMFELKKKYSGVMFDCTKYRCKNWRKTDFRFQKWHEKFSKFSPGYFRKSRNLDIDGILLSKVEKCMSLKFTWELCVMTMMNDETFEEELTCQFKTNMSSLTNFGPSTWKSQKFAF